MSGNRFRQALATGRPLAGLWSQIPSATVVEILAQAGPDWLLLDMEHGQADLADVLAGLQAAAATEVPLLVRTPGHDPVTIKRLLDLGAETLLVPMVEDAGQAERLVAAMRYPPAGIRGVSSASRAAAYGRDKGYMAGAAERVALAVQIESPAGVAACAEIAAVEGVDALFVGPNDLAAGMGLLGQPRHAEVAAAIRRVLAAAAAAGKPVGTFGFSSEDAAAQFAAGFRFVSTATDVGLLVAGAQAALAGARGG